MMSVGFKSNTMSDCLVCLLRILLLLVCCRTSTLLADGEGMWENYSTVRYKQGASRDFFRRIDTVI